jgi:secondary thiamine-phosphate synthase enzyme
MFIWSRQKTYSMERVDKPLSITSPAQNDVFSLPYSMPSILTSSTTTTIVFLFVLILAFFPHSFHFVLKAPLLLLSPFHIPPSRPAAAATVTIFPSPFSAPTAKMSTSTSLWAQKSFTLPSKSRGSYLITSEVEAALPEISTYKIGLLNLFLQHTSCALSLNENWDEDVRADMSDALDRIAPEDRKGGLYRHDAEGRDDMPVRSFLLFGIAGL